METKFQTSFIPRKQMPSAPGATMSAPHHSSGGGNIFMTISTIIFVLSILSIGGALLWKQYLVKEQIKDQQALVASESTFDINTIRQLKAESTKITLAKNLLAGHLAVSKLFSVVSSLTAENVRFLSMDFSGPGDKSVSANQYQVSLIGYGKDLTTVAFQAQVLNKLGDFGLKPVVKNPIVSDPTFNLNGTISFNLTASVDPSVLLYQVGSTNNQASSSGQTQ